MDNEQIKRTIEHFKDGGVNVRVRDIAFTLLSKMFADGKTAYQCLFGGDADGYDDYASDEMRDLLKDYLTDEGFIKTVSTDNETGGLTFEENRREMEALLKKTQQAMDDGLVDPKDGLKIMADVRVKLNDKFKVESKRQERTIIVQRKFDFGCCPVTHHECYQLDKEEAMKRWNLIENDKKQ